MHFKDYVALHSFTQIYSLFSSVDLLILTSLFMVHLHCSICENFIRFWGWIIFDCMYRPHFVYPFIHHWWMLGFFQPLSLEDNASVNICVPCMHICHLAIFPWLCLLSPCTRISSPQLGNKFRKLGASLISADVFCPRCLAGYSDKSTWCW